MTQDRPNAEELVEACKELGIEPLVEVHTRAEMEKVLRTKALLIGINNRNLHTFHGILLDSYVAGTYGGTGQVSDWNLARQAKTFGRIILAGGLTPESVQQAIREVAPYAVDVSSGVEKTPGLKDAEKMWDFVRWVRSL